MSIFFLVLLIAPARVLALNTLSSTLRWLPLALTVFRFVHPV